jgi:primosomal protein N' (replication factor Y)
LVYHSKENSLRCHYCQKSEVVPDICPNCHSRYIRYFGTGTQKLEDELVKLLPEARIVRMDRDTTSSKHSYDKILQEFSKGRYDILLGTQMVAKGHDVKNVTAVGIISVDTVLNLPDFRAAERAFSLLTQAAGRAGRGDKPGHVVVQVYTPEHYAIQAGIQHDYNSFFEQEIIWRNELNYPPFSQLLKVTIQSKNERTARHLADEFATLLRQIIKSDQTQVVGPFNAAIYRVKDMFRIHILLKTTELSSIRKHIKNIDLLARHEISIDVDPLSVM